MATAPRPSRHSVIQALRGLDSGLRRFQRSTSAPSRRSSVKLGQLQTSDLTLKSRSRSSAAARTSRRMVPLPRSWARRSPVFGFLAALAPPPAPLAPAPPPGGSEPADGVVADDVQRGAGGGRVVGVAELVHALDDSRLGAFRHVGVGVVLVHQGDVVVDVFLVGEHAAHAVLQDHGHFVARRSGRSCCSWGWRRPAGASGRLRAAGLRRSAWCGRRWRRAGSRARACRRRARRGRRCAGSRTSSRRCRTAASAGCWCCSWWRRPSS